MEKYYKLPSSVKTAEDAREKAQSLCSCYRKSFVGISWVNAKGITFQMSWKDAGVVK
jgi:hypothetical protein